MDQQHMLLKLRKPILKYTLNKYHVHWLSSFKHLKLPISIVCLFDLILYVPSTIFQLNRDRSSLVELVLSSVKCVLLKDHNAVNQSVLKYLSLYGKLFIFT